MKSAVYIFGLAMGSFLFPGALFAQEKPPADGISFQQAKTEETFQNFFFEALKYKAIEQHEKAISALEKCLDFKPKEAILYVEMGKNQKALKNYLQAEKNFQKALFIRPNSPYVRIALYEIYAATKNYSKAIPEVKRLVRFDPDYYQDLANLYMLSKQPKAALAVLDKLDKIKGVSPYTKNLRQEIFKATGNIAGKITYLEAQIKKSPKSQENYLRLINLYGVNEHPQKALYWAKKLREKHPQSEKLHLALFQIYLDQGQTEKAIASLKIVVSGKNLKPKTKMLALKHFTSYVKAHPEYREALKKILDSAMQTGEAMASQKELGNFYRQRDKEKALVHYQKSLQDNFNDLQTIMETLEIQLELKHYEDALNLSKKALSVFPSHAKLYLSQGKIDNALQKYSSALERLEIGMIYIVDNPKLKSEFYHEKASAYHGLSQLEEAAQCRQKANELKQKN